MTGAGLEPGPSLAFAMLGGAAAGVGLDSDVVAEDDGREREDASIAGWVVVALRARLSRALFD